MGSRSQVLAAVAGLRKVVYAPRWDDPRVAGSGLWEPRFVMLHHTAGLHSLSWLQKGGNYPPVPGAHFLIDRDGTVHVLTHFLAHHAGKGGPVLGVAAGMMNHFAWGIEIEDLGRSQTMTPAQIEAAARLSAGLLTAMGEPTSHLIEHETWNPKGKPNDTRYSMEFWHSAADQFRTNPTKPPQEAPVSYPVVSDGEYTEKLEGVKVPKGTEKVIRTLVLPKLKSGKWDVLIQMHYPKGVKATVRFVRVGWGAGQVDGLDPTGSGTYGLPDRVDQKVHRHLMEGGGPVRFTIESDTAFTAPWIVVKATALALAAV